MRDGVTQCDFWGEMDRRRRPCGCRRGPTGARRRRRDRENEGDLIMAADAVTPRTSPSSCATPPGVLCVALTGERLDALELPLMVPTQHRGARAPRLPSPSTPASGTTTGISAADRAATIRALADPAPRPADFARPGHVFPLRARPGGVLKRAGHTEAAVDLARLAGRAAGRRALRGRHPRPGAMARRRGARGARPRARDPADRVADLIRHRRRTRAAGAPAWRRPSCRPPTAPSPPTSTRSLLDGDQHLALVRGDLSTAASRGWSACTASA